MNEATLDEFTCRSCGAHITRFTKPRGYVSDICFMCQWLDSNTTLSEDERALLRRRLAGTVEQ
jgi:hypothetical protein